MNVTRRSFIAGVTAFTLAQEGLSAGKGSAAVSFYEVSGKASDFLMCRRLYIDLCGRLPTPEEAREYVKSKDSHKLENLVDSLLASYDFGDFWAMRYCDILRVKAEYPINLWPNAVYVYHRRIRQSILDDEPWPDFARALLCARGSNFRIPETNFLRASAQHSPEAISEAATMTFLMEPTTKYSYYFSRVGFKSTKEWKEEIVYLKDGPADAVPEGFMDELEGPLRAKFVATPVRRVYYWLYDSWPRQGPQDELVGVYRKNGFRLKPLLRHICLSSAYKAGPLRGKFPARRLDAEVLDDAICSITGATHSFSSLAPEPYTFIPPRRKAVLLEDGSISSAFLMLFGRPARDTGAMEERKNEITKKQRLYLYNSGSLWSALGRFERDERLLAMKHAEQVEELFMRFLSRPPSKEELALIDPKGSARARDIGWYLVNSYEFLYRI